MSETFEPVIVGFLCNWCSYRAADLAGTARIHYAPNMRPIRVMCSGRVDPQFEKRWHGDYPSWGYSVTITRSPGFNWQPGLLERSQRHAGDGRDLCIKARFESQN